MEAAMKLARLLAVLLVALMLVPGAFAQSCSQCYASAAQAGPEAQHGLNVGILILLCPSVLLFGGVIFFAARRANAEVNNLP